MKKILQKSERGMAFLLALLLAVSSPISVLAANPVITEVKDEGQDLDYTFTETTSEDGKSADVQLEVIEKNGNTLTEISMPDGTVIYPETKNGQDGFKQSVDGVEKNIIHYEATQNGAVKFKLKYNATVAAPIEQEAIPETQEQPESKKEFQSEPKEESQPEVQSESSEPEESTETSQSETKIVPEEPKQEEPEQEGDSLLSKAIDTLFPVMEVQAAEPGSITEEREMEVSYEVISILPQKESENESIEKSETVQNQDNNVNLLEDVSADATGSISISTNNTAITQPSDFVIGDPDQELINLTVRYAPSNNNSGRKAKITIPEGFSLVKVPSASDLTSASEVIQNGNVLEIIFYDSMNITAVFDIQVRQNKELLYKNASEASKDYNFLLEGFANDTESVLSEKLTFSIDELVDAVYQIEVKPNLVWEDVKKASSLSVYNSVEYGWKITKLAKSKKQETFEIYVPRKLVSGDYFLSSPKPNSITINGKSYLRGSFSDNFTVQTTDDYYVLFPRTEGMKELIQNTYLQDSVIEVSMAYRDTTSTDKLEKLYVNERYESISDAMVKVNGAEVYTTPLTLDTTATIKAGFTMTSSMKDQVHMAGTDVSNKIGITANPANYNLRDVEATLEIPEEFLVKGITSGNVAEIKTNKDRVIESSEVSALGEDEYVKYIKLFGDLRHHTALEVTLDIHVRKTMVDGTVIASPTYAKITGEVSSTESIVNATNVSQQFKITNKVNDNITLDNYSDSSMVSLTGTLNASIKSFQLVSDHTNLDTMIYKNAEIEITGDAVLSLTDTIGFEEADAEEIQKIKVLYTTHLNGITREALPVAEGRMYYAKCDVDEGDYVTSLKICSTELDLCKGKYDYYTRFSLISSKLPEQLPLDNSSVDGKNYTATVKFTADNTDKHREVESSSYTFKVPVDADIMSVNDMSGTQVNCDKQDIELASILLDKIDDKGRINYENSVIDFTGTDPELLSMITKGVSISGTEKNPISFNWYYSTNQRAEVQHAFNLNQGNLDLKDGEYITSLKMVWDWNNYGLYPNKDVTVTLFGKPEAYSKITGQYIGDDYKSYTVKASFEADNKTKYLREGKSVSITGKSTVTANGMTSTVNLSEYKVYQGNSFDVTIAPIISVANPAYRDFCVKSPVFYVEVDSRYSFESGSFVTGIESGKATWEAGKLANGNSVLKIEFPEYEKKFGSTNINVSLAFRLRAKLSVEPAKGIQPIVSLWADLSETATYNQPESYADVILENTVKDTAGMQDDADKEFYTVSTSVAGGQEILPVNEMGIFSQGIENASFGETVKGHDNDQYGQQLSIISNYDEPTKDWIIYIPIPKEGKSVHYKTVENGIASVGESPEAGIGMNLTGPVQIDNAPAGTTITYTTDDSPAYALDGSSVNGYSDSVDDWSKVTMVKIEVPELDARGKIYPILNYASDTKLKTNDLMCYGGVYFNAKVGDAADYFYGSEGNYAKNNSYTIMDYQVTGHVWEEMAVPSDSILTDTDQAKAGVTVSTTSKDGTELKAVTDANGNYTLLIPSHGDYEIAIQMPDNNHAKPNERYTLVEKNKGNGENSSKFDPATKKISVTLDKEDMTRQNAGLWAERVAFVEPEDIYMAKGQTENVPVYYFPAYVEVTYGQAADTQIATVSDDGIITALETGVTTAEVSIPDGNGGTVTDTYNIHVIPQKPTAVPETVHIFEGGSFDPETGVTVTDGDGNTIPVDDPKISIDNPVDTAVPGKYTVTYTITDEYNRVVKAYRSIYVHEKIQIVKPADWLTKTGTEITSLDGVSASYGQIQEDGGIKRVEVPVIANPADTFTLNAPGKQKVELTATVTYEGAVDTANDSYMVTFHDRPVITAPDEIYVKPGTAGTALAHAIGGSASMGTADGSVDLTDELIYERDSSFDTSIPNSSGKVILEVTDPDTGEVITKEVMVHITGEAAITAEDLDVVAGQTYDPAAKVTITDGRGNPITLTPDMIKKDNVPVNTDGELTAIGEYEVTYHYKDVYGNEAEAKRTVKVNGPLVLETPDRHLRQEAGGSYAPDTASAYYMNSKNVKTEVTGGTYSVASVDLENIAVTAVTYKAVHPVSKEETEQGFDIYVHGSPVITAEGDTIYTHTSTGSKVLVDVVKDGVGNGHKTPAAAYVEYARKDGTTQRVDLTVLIQYEVSDTYTANTQGTYPVALSVSDALYVLAAAPGLAPAEALQSVDVVVADKSYDITFEAGNHGTFEEGDTLKEQVVHGDVITDVPTPKPEPGYEFDGWEDGDGNAIKNFSKYPITGDTTITGVFKAKEYTVKYDTDGGVPDAIEKKEGIHFGDARLLPPDTLTKPGYTFGGWFYQDAPVSEATMYRDLAVDDTVMEITLTAQWTAKQYTVNYDTNGGKPEHYTAARVSFTATIPVPAEIPVRTGYEFKGWVKDDTKVDGVKTTYDSLVKDDTVKEITLIAGWEKKNYTVDFAVEPGERGGELDGNYAQQTVAYEEHADRGAGIKVNKGSAFLGWSYSYTPEGEAEAISGTIYDYTRIPITADITFVAQFARIPFVSGISTNGYVAVQKGSAPADAGTSTSTKIEYDTDETLPAEAGFKFKGADHHHIAGITFKDLAERDFTVDINSTQAQIFTVGDTAEDTAQIELTVNKADGTLHIKGIEDSLKFTFVFEEDTKYSVSFKEEMDSVDNWSQTTGLFAGDKLGEAPVTNPSKPGYAFGGWSSDGSDDPDKMFNKDAVISDKDEVFYAVWVMKEYTVHYEMDGGNPAVQDKTVHYTDAGLLPDQNPTKPGYEFAGWKKGGLQVNTDTAYNTLVADDTVAEITLTAQWTAKQYRVSYDTDGGEPEQYPSETVGFTSIIPVPAGGPAKTGYMFKGWSKDGTLVDGITTTYDSLAADDTVMEITLTAQWEKKTYTVDFAVEPGERGGELAGTTTQQTVPYEDYAGRGAGVKVNKGSAFLGWSYTYTPEGKTEAVSGTIFDYTRMPITGDVTFVAQFAKIPFISGISTNGYVAVQKGSAPAEAGTATTAKIEYDTGETLPAEAGFKFKGADHYHIAGITFEDLSGREFTVDIGSTEEQRFTVGDTTEDTAEIGITVDKADSALLITGIEDSLKFTFAFEEDTKYSVSFKEEKDSADNWSQTTGLFAGDKMGPAPAASPAKPGYVFGGWSSDGTDSQDKMYDADARITDKDEVYYAVWTAKEYTIHYNTDGGTLVADKTNVHYTDTGLIPDEPPKKAGHIFAGWEKDTQAVGADTAYNSLVADDTVMEVTLKAKWTVKTFKAVWKTADGETGGIIDGGTQTEDGITYQTYATKDVAATPSSTDGELIGWEYSYIPDGGKDAVTGFTDNYKSIPVLGDITFTAKFADKIFVSIGAVNGRVTAAKGTAAEEIESSSATSALVQYGASDINDGKATATLKYAANIHYHLDTITFKDFEGHEYKIYTKDGSQVTTGPEYEVGGKTPASQITVTLDEKNGTIQVSGIDTSLAFTVVFKADATYKVEFFTEKGNPDSLVKTNSGLYTGNPVGDKPETDPVKKGYAFLGWSMDGTFAPDKMYDRDTKIKDADIAYYAVWAAKEYRVHYDLNGGSSDPKLSSKTVGFMDANLLPKDTVITRAGYEFTGWKKEIRAVTDTMTYSELVNGDDTVGEIVLIAQWKPYSYEVIFDKNAENAEGTMENQRFLFDEEKALTENAFIREGYTFAGWAVVPDRTVVYTDKQTVKNLTTEKDGKVILYAMWNEIGDTKYTVEHYKQEKDGSWPEKASETESKSAKPGTVVNAQAKTYEGYAFDSSVKGTIISGTVTEDGKLVLKLYYKVRLTVSFDSNGGNYTPENQSVTYGGQAVRPENPTRSGYIFDGWYGKNLDGKEQKWNFNDAVTADIKLTAHWKKTAQPVTPSYPGGTVNRPGISTGGTSAVSTRSVKTGDTTNIALFILLLICSAAILVTVIYKKKRRNEL